MKRHNPSTPLHPPSDIPTREEVQGLQSVVDLLAATGITIFSLVLVLRRIGVWIGIYPALASYLTWVSTQITVVPQMLQELTLAGYDGQYDLLGLDISYKRYRKINRRDQKASQRQEIRKKVKQQRQLLQRRLARSIRKAEKSRSKSRDQKLEQWEYADRLAEVQPIDEQRKDKLDTRRKKNRAERIARRKLEKKEKPVQCKVEQLVKRMEQVQLTQPLVEQQYDREDQYYLSLAGKRNQPAVREKRPTKAQKAQNQRREIENAIKRFSKGGKGQPKQKRKQYPGPANPPNPANLPSNPPAPQAPNAVVNSAQSPTGPLPSPASSGTNLAVPPVTNPPNATSQSPPPPVAPPANPAPQNPPPVPATSPPVPPPQPVTGTQSLPVNNQAVSPNAPSLPTIVAGKHTAKLPPLKMAVGTTSKNDSKVSVGGIDYEANRAVVKIRNVVYNTTQGSRAPLSAMDFSVVTIPTNLRIVGQLTKMKHFSTTKIVGKVRVVTVNNTQQHSFEADSIPIYYQNTQDGARYVFLKGRAYKIYSAAGNGLCYLQALSMYATGSYKPGYSVPSHNFPAYRQLSLLKIGAQNAQLIDASSGDKYSLKTNGDPYDAVQLFGDMIGSFPITDIPTIEDFGLRSQYNAALLDYGLLVRTGGLAQVGHYEVAFPLTRNADFTPHQLSAQLRVRRGTQLQMRTVKAAVFQANNNFYSNQPSPGDTQLLGALQQFVFCRVSVVNSAYVIDPAIPTKKRFIGSILFGTQGHECVYHVFSEKYMDWGRPVNPLALIVPLQTSTVAGGGATLILYHLDRAWELGLESWVEDKNFSPPPNLAFLALGARKAQLANITAIAPQSPTQTIASGSGQQATASTSVIVPASSQAQVPIPGVGGSPAAGEVKIGPMTLGEHTVKNPTSKSQSQVQTYKNSTYVKQVQTTLCKVPQVRKHFENVYALNSVSVTLENVLELVGSYSPTKYGYQKFCFDESLKQFTNYPLRRATLGISPVLAPYNGRNAIPQYDSQYYLQIQAMMIHRLLKEAIEAEGQAIYVTDRIPKMSYQLFNSSPYTCIVRRGQSDGGVFCVDAPIEQIAVHLSYKALHKIVLISSTRVFHTPSWEDHHILNSSIVVYGGGLVYTGNSKILNTIADVDGVLVARPVDQGMSFSLGVDPVVVPYFTQQVRCSHELFTQKLSQTFYWVARKKRIEPRTLVPEPSVSRRLTYGSHALINGLTAVRVHRSLKSLTKSTLFLVPNQAILDIQESVGLITASTPKQFIKAAVAKSQLTGWLRSNRLWCNEYHWVLTGYFLEMRFLDDQGLETLGVTTTRTQSLASQAGNVALDILQTAMAPVTAQARALGQQLVQKGVTQILLPIIRDARQFIAPQPQQQARKFKQSQSLFGALSEIFIQRNEDYTVNYKKTFVKLVIIQFAVYLLVTLFIRATPLQGDKVIISPWAIPHFQQLNAIAEVGELWDVRRVPFAFMTSMFWGGTLCTQKQMEGFEGHYLIPHGSAAVPQSSTWELCHGRSKQQVKNALQGTLLQQALRLKQCGEYWSWQQFQETKNHIWFCYNPTYFIQANFFNMLVPLIPKSLEPYYPPIPVTWVVFFGTFVDQAVIVLGLIIATVIGQRLRTVAPLLRIAQIVTRGPSKFQSRLYRFIVERLLSLATRGGAKVPRSLKPKAQEASNPVVRYAKEFATRFQHRIGFGAFAERCFRNVRWGKGGKTSVYQVPLNVNVHVNKETYQKGVSPVDLERFSFRIGKRRLGINPPPYETLPCTCGSRVTGKKVVQVMANGKAVDIHFYRSCVINLVFGVYGRHFSQKTRPAKEVVQAMRKRTTQWIADQLVPHLAVLQDTNPNVLKVLPHDYIQHHVLPSKREVYRQQYEQFISQGHKTKPVYKLFVKSNEPNPITEGKVGDKKPRFVINPQGIKGAVGPIMHAVMNAIGCIPTFKGCNGDGMSQQLQSAQRDMWISADGSNWDSTQYYEVFQAVDHPVLRTIFEFLDFSQSGLTDYHIQEALKLAVSQKLPIKYRKKGIKIDVLTKDFTASGVFDRTNLNYVRQYIGGTCQHHINSFQATPHHSLSTLIATGDDGLRSVHKQYSQYFLQWMDYLYYPGQFLVKNAVTAATTGWLRKSAHSLSKIPESISKIFVKVRAGYLPVRPLEKMVTTAMVNRTNMKTTQYHAGTAFAYAPQTNAIGYYQSFAQWRSALAVGVKSAQRHLTKIWGAQSQFKVSHHTSQLFAEREAGEYNGAIAHALGVSRLELNSFLAYVSQLRSPRVQHPLLDSLFPRVPDQTQPNRVTTIIDANEASRAQLAQALDCGSASPEGC